MIIQVRIKILMSLRKKKGEISPFANVRCSTHKGEIPVYADGKSCLQNFKTEHYDIHCYFKPCPINIGLKLSGAMFPQSVSPYRLVSVFTAPSGLFSISWVSLHPCLVTQVVLSITNKSSTKHTTNFFKI